MVKNDNNVKVLVPATTANLGPGFDCLGMALELWNQVVIEEALTPSVEVQGEGKDTLPTNTDNVVYMAARRVFQEISQEMPSLKLTCHNAIPLSRGLGSSAAAVVGGLFAANLFCGEPLTQSELLDLAVTIEGHPDNVAPALLGGCQIVVRDDDEIMTSEIVIDQALRAVLYIPDVKIDTPAARAVLSQQVSRQDAVYNLGHVALLVNALAGGRLEFLRKGTRDRLHQPARKALISGMDAIFGAAMAAGALGVFLSGSGPTILAFAQGREMTIAYEMAEAADKAGLFGTYRVVNISKLGVHRVF